MVADIAAVHDPAGLASDAGRSAGRRLDHAPRSRAPIREAGFSPRRAEAAAHQIAGHQHGGEPRQPLPCDHRPFAPAGQRMAGVPDAMLEAPPPVPDGIDGRDAAWRQSLRITVSTIGRRSQMRWLAFFSARETACLDRLVVVARLALQLLRAPARPLGQIVEGVAPADSPSSPGRPRRRTSMSATILPRSSSAKVTISTPLVGGVAALAQGLAVLRRPACRRRRRGGRDGTSSMISARPGARRTMSPLRGATGCGHLQVLGQGGVLEQVAALAVGRHGDLRPRPVVHLLQLVAARVAGDVDARMVALGVEAHAAVGELVLQVADRRSRCRG